MELYVYAFFYWLIKKIARKDLNKFESEPKELMNIILFYVFV